MRTFPGQRNLGKILPEAEPSGKGAFLLPKKKFEKVKFSFECLWIRVCVSCDAWNCDSPFATPTGMGMGRGKKGGIEPEDVELSNKLFKVL